MIKKLHIPFFLLASIIFRLPCFADSGEDLRRAINLEDLPLLKQHLANGADANAMVDDRPVLGWAAQNGNADIVRALLDAKADPNALDLGFKETPLLRAAENEHLDVVKELIKAKANLNASNARGETALVLAVKQAQPEMVKVLIEAGADVTYLSPDGDSLALFATQVGSPANAEIISILAKAKADLNRSNLMHTPLYYAAQLEDAALVKALLDGGANPNALGENRRTPLSAALKCAECVKHLLAAKADPNLSSEGTSPPLIAAIENGTPEVVQALIKGGADVNVSDSYGNSALQVAQNYSQTDLIKLLKDSGARE